MLDQIIAPAEAEAATCYGISAGCRVLTLRGGVAVEDLAPGERVITRNGARTLRGVEAVDLPDQDVVRIAPGALGHDRPEAAMILPAGQRVFLRDWRAQAMYGMREAMVPAGRLVDGEFLRADRVGVLRLYRLRFDGPEILYVDGVEIASGPMVV